MADAGPAYSFDELQQIWLDAGGALQQQATAAAIAMNESGGCRYALAGPLDVRPSKSCRFRYTTGENSFGLWQINVAPGANPGFMALDLFDPAVNAKVAVFLFNRNGNFSDWTTYTSQTYLAFLPAADTPAAPGTYSSPAGTPTPVKANTHLPTYQSGQVHLSNAWAIFTAGLEHELHDATKRAINHANRMRAAVK